MTTETTTPNIGILIEGILERHCGAYYFRMIAGTETDGRIECVISKDTPDGIFEAEGYKFRIEGHRHENINDEDTDPETNGGYIDIPTHDIYTISYQKIAIVIVKENEQYYCGLKDGGYIGLAYDLKKAKIFGSETDAETELVKIREMSGSSYCHVDLTDNIDWSKLK